MQMIWLNYYKKYKGGLIMENKKVEKILLLFCFVAMLITGCASMDTYKNVFNDEKNLNSRTFNASIDDCYFATKRAILSQNFRIEKEDLQAKSFTAAKYFEDGKDTIVVTINANVISAGNGKATVYATATQYVDKVRVKVDRTFLGLVPVGSEATKVKQEEKTIEDEEFYNKLFNAIKKELNNITGK